MNDRLSLLLMAAVTPAWASMAQASGDWQYWNQFVLKHKFDDRFSLALASEQKIRDDFSDLYLYNTTIVPTMRLAEGVSLGAGYRWEQQEQDDEWRTENRLLFPLTLTWSPKPWTLQWRNQPEYRDLETRDRWRLRERIQIARPGKLGTATVTPFASGEVFYDFTDEEVNQNRLAVGVLLPLREYVDLSVFYLNRADKDGDWSSTNVLGTEVIFEF